jgi:hypothetical protein
MEWAIGNYHPPVADPNARQSYSYSYPGPANRIATSRPSFVSLGAVNLTHASRAKRRDDLIRTEFRARCEVYFGGNHRGRAPTEFVIPPGTASTSNQLVLGAVFLDGLILQVLSRLALATGRERVAAPTETILGQLSRCEKRLESFMPTHYCGASALDDGFETICFEVLARACGGLRVGVRSDLNAIIIVGAGGDDECGEFFLLQSLGEGHGVTFAYDCRDLEHDGSLRDQRRARRGGIFRRRHGL